MLYKSSFSGEVPSSVRHRLLRIEFSGNRSYQAEHHLCFLGSCVVKNEKIASKGSLCKHLDIQLFQLTKDKNADNVGAQEMPQLICIVANGYKQLHITDTAPWLSL